MIPLKNFKRFWNKTLKQPGYALRVFYKRLKADFFYRLGNGKSSYPESITLFLTHLCNLRCKMCGQWGEGGVTKKQSAQFIHAELSTQELKSIIADISFFKPNMTLFGGEPLLHPGCTEIIKEIKKQRMHCLMITNGSLLLDYAESLVESGLDELNLSLDGDRELHDEIRGMPGVFDKIMNGLKKINYFKASLKKSKPLINLQCTINKFNYRSLGQLTDVAKRSGADSLTFHNLIFLNREVIEKQKEYDKLLECSSQDWEGFVFDPEIDPDLLFSEMKKITDQRYNFSLDFYPSFSHKVLNDYYRDPCFVPLEYPARCLSPWIVSYVFPDGEVRPCLNCTYSFGNVKNYRFTEIWNSDQAVRYRKALKASKIFPVCVRCTELYRY